MLDSALIRKTANTKDLTFNNYLGKHEESDYRNVRWNEIRNHHNTEREGMRSSYPRRRHATFCKALFYDFYATMLMDYLGRRMWNHQWRRLVAIITLGLLNFVFGPMYIISRIFNVMLPVLIPIYLLGNEGWNIIEDMDSFQIIMWCGYVLLMVIWLCLLYVVCRDEFYLWHIIPNVEYLRGNGDTGDTTNLHVARLVMENYEEITQNPFVRKVLMNHFGDDIANIVMEYVNAINLHGGEEDGIAAQSGDAETTIFV